MPGIRIGEVYIMKLVGGPFLARDGDDDEFLIKVMEYEDDNGNNHRVTMEWFKKHNEPARIIVNTKKGSIKIKPLKYRR